MFETPEMAKFTQIKVLRNGPVLEVTLNRPDRFNALNGAAHAELHDVFNAYEADPSLRVAILTGAGERAFCSGNDLKATQNGEEILPQSSGFAGQCFRFERVKPVIAAINGLAMGGGFEIVLACDIALSVPGAQFALPEVKVGLFAAAGGVQRLIDQTGRKAAMDLLLTGRAFDAKRALELGLINEIVAPDQLLPAARARASEICAAAPLAVEATMALVNASAAAKGQPDQIRASQDRFEEILKTADAQEGVAAFVEKRQPQWSGS